MLNLIKKESGQMLLFVLVILLLLFIILIAIVVNVRQDLRSSQEEREYEQAYAFVEGELLNIIDIGYSEWAALSGYNLYTSTLCPVSGSEGCNGAWECKYKCGFGDTGQDCVITKSCGTNSITNETVLQDKTLEVALNGYSGNLNISWSGAAALDLIFVYTKSSPSNEYGNTRRVACQDGSTYGEYYFPGCRSILSGTSINVFNMIASGNTSKFLRIRPIGADATITVTGGLTLPLQRTILRVQGVTNADADANGIIDPETDLSYAGLSAPEVYTSIPAFKQMPSIFDYVLFVADGAAGHD